MSLMNDQNHAVLLTAISLVIEMVKIKPSHKKKFRKVILLGCSGVTPSSERVDPLLRHLSRTRPYVL